ncbi:wall-associated receptor kinase 3-like [Cryptomeria japonica]|uniref:wall-associated receptor kinase 3-like n=1 Tax=Cryptomeria japonica TaxID=3369 RepID=UPI0027DA832C|nr:wall-associated receptor kinase 3-like [Cryptomeria japonica]
MHCGVVARCLICVCLVGFTAAKCVPEKCGSMNVSYPFWIHISHCGHPRFKITCREDKYTGMLAPYFTAFRANSTGLRGDFTDVVFDRNSSKIMDIDYEGHLIINSSSIKAFSCDDDPNNGARNYFELPSGGPFTLSNSNRLVVLGNKTFGTYSFGDLGETRCVTMNRQSDQPYCRYGCCEINLPDNLPFVNFTGGGLFQLPNDNTTKCGFSTIMDPSTFTMVDNKTNPFWRRGNKAYYGIRLNWGIGEQDCAMAKDTTDYSCVPNAECLDSPSGKGHVCKCLPGYEGNGYSNGTDCTGSYNCSCANGYVGDGFANGTGCKSTTSNSLVFPAITGAVVSFVVVSLAASLLVWSLKKRHMKLVEVKYYQLLQRHIASTMGRESLRIFSAKELARASKNYSNEMALGSGGFGTVFKGILSDGTLVAIKKSKQALNLEDDHEFLNEVTILSQINHRNIVKLLGCCIQTKFPLLVSEFVPNGTLFQHLHSKEGSLPWTSRLQIAIETGEALAYLHSGASQPIFHRDVKSSNILLNEKLSPKVADFGISRLISASNNTHVTTFNIKGTWGYLDPEFFQTSQLTEKSDVYSFGVVLVELLTSLKPISLARDNEDMTLSSLFLSRLDQNRLTEILDNRVLEKENLQEMEDMARIARECLHLERRKRPSMKEVVEELVSVRGGTRKTKSHDNEKCEEAIFEERSISREASPMPYKCRSCTFSSPVRSTALVEISILTE